MKEELQKDKSVTLWDETAQSWQSSNWSNFNMKVNQAILQMCGVGFSEIERLTQKYSRKRGDSVE